MNRILLRKTHRWIFTLIGIFMILQIVSGLIMTAPPDWFGAKNYWHKNPPADYHQAMLSPADAIARLETGSASPTEIKQVKLRQIDGHLLYSIVLADGSEQLIDAATGMPFNFSQELAESMVRSRFGINAPLKEIEKLTEHSAVYPWGSLPVYRMTFDDSSSESYFLVQGDLKMYRSSPVTRARAAIISLHAFEPVSLITHDRRVRIGLMLLIFGAALAGAIAGILLILPRQKRQAGTGRN